jgi:hypothetical protein
VLARVGPGGVTVTVGEFEDLLNDAPPSIRQSYSDPARRREQLESLVNTMLLAEEGRRRGLERDPDVAARIRRTLAQRTERTLILEAITPESVTDTEVASWYQAHLTDFQQPEFRRATALFTADRAAAEAALTEVRRARMNLQRVRELVRERSVDEPSRSHEGDLFYFRREGMVSTGDGRVDPALAQAVAALAREMDATAPVAVAGGRFAVAVLTGRRPALDRPLRDPDVGRSIRGFIVRQRREDRRTELLENLRARLHPELHEDRIDALRLPPTDLGSLPVLEPDHNPGP